MSGEQSITVRPQDRVLAVIPAKDEEPTVATVVRDVRRLLGCPVLVVDDGSTDATAARATDAGAIVLSLPFSLGAWCASQAGLRYAVEHGYTTAVTLDADGQHHAESIPILLKELRDAGSDLVIGACPERLSVAKHIAWRYFRWLTRLSIQDFTSGLRVYGSNALRTLASRQASLLDYQDVGVLLLLARQGMVIREVQVNMSNRMAGHSRVFSSWFTVFHYMLQTTLLCVSRFDAQRPRTREAES
ncbi:MAG: glycosyltransferase family 2 protein [Pseudomonadota bacterium]